MSGSELFRFPDPVNEVSARLVAAGVAVMSTALLVTGWHWIVLVLTYGFVARVLTGPTLSPLGQLVTRVITPALHVEPKYVPGPPKRFAQGIGATLTVIAAILTYGVDEFGVARLLVAAVLVAASLESVFAFCLGCKIFNLLMRVGVIPESVCERCNDIRQRAQDSGYGSARENRTVLADRPPRAVLLDFYGTLARATQWVSVDVVLAEHGVELDDELRDRYWNDGLDGIEHFEHSSSRDHYVAWQQQRILAMLAETDLHPGEYEVVLEKLRAGNASRVLEAYDEVPEVLAALRQRGLILAICSNWDWDLAEAVDEAGVTTAVDVIVSSAWAGARKPHPRIFGHTLAKVGVEPSEVVFVGDTWGPDVVGPRAFGMTPVYLRRDGHWPDDTAPPDYGSEGVAIAADLRALMRLPAL